MTVSEAASLKPGDPVMVHRDGFAFPPSTRPWEPAAFQALSKSKSGAGVYTWDRNGDLHHHYIHFTRLPTPDELLTLEWPER